MFGYDEHFLIPTASSWDLADILRKKRFEKKALQSRVRQAQTPAARQAQTPVEGPSAARSTSPIYVIDAITAAYCIASRL